MHHSSVIISVNIYLFKNEWSVCIKGYLKDICSDLYCIYFILLVLQFFYIYTEEWQCILLSLCPLGFLSHIQKHMKGKRSCINGDGWFYPLWLRRQSALDVHLSILYFHLTSKKKKKCTVSSRTFTLNCNYFVPESTFLMAYNDIMW